MKQYSHIKQTRREFIREKRRAIKEAKIVLRKLRHGCALRKLFGGTSTFDKAVRRMETAIETMDRITKKLR